jgi:hypothetical protein
MLQNVLDSLGSDTNGLKKEKIRISDNPTLSEMLQGQYAYWRGFGISK